MKNETTATLRVKDIRKTFNPGEVNEVKALQGISLDVQEGEFVMLLGGNGSGKSTLLNAVAGSFFPDAGRILVDGKDVTRWAEHRRAALVGRVFQNPFSGTAPDMTIAENFALASRRGLGGRLGWSLSRKLRRDVRERVAALRMGLEDRLNNAIGSLSGGQRQALTLLMATWNRPRLLLLDEHTAALDPKSAEQVIRLTMDIVARDAITTLMVTHSMAQAVNLGNRLVMLHKGRLIHDDAGADKRRLKVEDLLERFDEVRRRELLDETAAALLREQYV